MERYSVSLRIQSECGKTGTRITPNTDTFYAVTYYRHMSVKLTTIKKRNEYQCATINKEWDRRFININIDKKLTLSIQTIGNVISNYIQHDTLMCDDRDPPRIFNKVN